MKSILLRWAILIAIPSLLVSCGGGGGGGGAPACTPNGNISLHSSSTGTTLLSSITVTTLQSVSVTPVPVFVKYTKPPVAAVLAGYPPGAADPRTVVIDIVPFGSPTANPLQFSLTFDSTKPMATYLATWRFVVVDAGANVLGCQDLPVTFTIN